VNNVLEFMGKDQPLGNVSVVVGQDHFTSFMTWQTGGVHVRDSLGE